jgi:hypothetical chaperone protein
MDPIAYGIDFGTTNSSIAVAYPDRVEVVPVSATGIPEVMPSIVYLHRMGMSSAGEEAVKQYLVTGSNRTSCARCDLVERDRWGTYTDCRQYAPGGGCLDARVASELKAFLADETFTSTHSWARDFDLADLVGVVIRELKRAADRAIGADVRRAVIGHPVLFFGAEGVGSETRQRLALERMREAAVRAGFEELVFVEEPAAVVADEEIQRGLAVVVDFGGGTFDVAVVQLAPDGGEVLALEGAGIGGELFTKLLFEHKVAPALGLDGTVPGIPAWLRVRLRSLAGVFQVLSDREVPGLIRAAARSSGRIDVLQRILYGGFAYQFYKAVEDAKIALSSSRRTSIEFHRPGVDLSIPVMRQEFESMIAEYLDGTIDLVRVALERAGIATQDVDTVLRTGGSSGIPAFVARLGDLLGPEKIVERPVYTTVVHGLAAHARGRWAR